MDKDNPEAQALAIAANKFLKAGSNESVLQTRQRSTVIIDAKGKRVIPGLFDSHLHVIRGGRFYLPFFISPAARLIARRMRW